MQNITGPEAAPKSGNPAKQLIVFLHGVGADGNDLFSLAGFFAELFPDAHFTSPNAPFPCDMAPFGYQWFSLLDRSPDALHAGVTKVEPILNHYLDSKLEALGLEAENLAIIGFSQGTMTALHTLPRREKAVAGLVGFSGAMVKSELLENEVTVKPPVCLVHGDVDEVVPFAAMEDAQKALEKAAIPVEAHRRPGLGHGIDEEGIKIALQFLHQQFSA